MWFLRLRYAVRSLARDSVFVMAVLLVLSLGTAASTSIFTVIEQTVLHPFPYQDPDRLVEIWDANPAIVGPVATRTVVAWKNFVEWRNQTHSFAAIEAYEQATFNLTGLGNPEQFPAARATGGYFQMLGVAARTGRTLLPSDSLPGAAPVVVLSDGMARSHFAGANPINRKILLNGAPYTVVGVLPGEFHLPLLFEGSIEYKPKIWAALPVVTAADPEVMSTGRRLWVTARLKPGVTLEQARADMTALSSRLAEADPKLNAGYTASVYSLKTENSDPDLGRALYILWGAAITVLLLGCLNLASLMTVRVMNKRRDLAVMAAIGAPKSVLVGSVIAESLLLALPAAAWALLGSYAGIAAVRSFNPIDLSGPERLHLDWHSFVAAAVTFLVSVLLFGVFPAWLNGRRTFNSALQATSRTGSGPLATLLRRVLVTVEVAITLVLAIGAMLLTRSFEHIVELDPGFRAHNVLTAHIVLPLPRYDKKEDREQFGDRLLDGVRQIPGVEKVSLADNFPLYSIHYAPFEIEGQPVPNFTSAPTSDYAGVSADYFQTMGTPLLRGRLFAPEDMQGEASNIIIVNDSFAQKFFPHRDPLGSHIRILSRNATAGAWRRVVGVVRGYREHNIDTDPWPEMFWPARDFRSGMTLVVRSAAGTAALLPELQHAVAAIDKDQPLADVQTLQSMVDYSISQRRFNMLLLTGFSGLGIVLALVGVYGLLSYVISSRARDIGIRLTLGAQRKHIFSSLILQIVPFAAAGLIAGVLVSFLAKALITSLLFEVSATDPAIYLALPLVLIVLVVLTCALPAWRATRIDPVTILRQE